jgi:hypothetical protein
MAMIARIGEYSRRVVAEVRLGSTVGIGQSPEDGYEKPYLRLSQLIVEKANCPFWAFSAPNCPFWAFQRLREWQFGVL